MVFLKYKSLFFDYALNENRQVIFYTSFSPSSLIDTWVVSGV